MNDQVRRCISALESEFEEPNGFLWQVRHGHFDPDRGESFIRTLSEMRIPDEDTIDRRFVSIILFIPLLLTWQIERIAASGGNTDEFRKLTGRDRHGNKSPWRALKIRRLS
jgi:hypothetical protein